MLLSIRRWSPLLSFLVVLTLVATFLRFWNFTDTLMFQGDQGRDALIVSQIFTHGDPVFIGPVTSVGNMYLGPLYYYFMLPFLYLSYPSPLGPAIAIAILGSLTVPLLYFLGRELVGKRAALIAAILCTFSASAVIYSRFSWNPNPAPIVALIMIWATYRAWQKSSWYWVLVSLCFSILLQLHYIALLSGLGASLIWIFQVTALYRSGATLRSPKNMQLLAATGAAVVVLLLSFTPLVLFDLKHDGLIRKAFVGLFIEEGIIDKSPVLSLTAKIAAVVKDSLGRGKLLLFEHTLGRYDHTNTGLFLTTLGILAWQLHRARRQVRPGLLVICSYLATGIVGTALYQHSLFVHYFTYLFPVIFLTLGLCLSWLSRQQGTLGLGLAGVLVLVFIALNIPKLPFTSQAWTIDDVAETSQTMYDHLRPGESYSLVLLSPSKDLYAQNYRYFLSTTDRPALPPELAATADTLVVINEEYVTNVAELPIYEILTFPDKDQPEVYTIPNGPEILLYRRHK